MVVSFPNMKTDRLECSVWTNGQNGWGVKILGGVEVRQLHLSRSLSPVTVVVDGVETPVNIDKASFWTPTCGELIHKNFKGVKDRHALNASDRVWLRILEPKRRSVLEVR
jgi:hypothetical protein